jgi:hypothetical protein
MKAVAVSTNAGASNEEYSAKYHSQQHPRLRIRHRMSQPSSKPMHSLCRMFCSTSKLPQPKKPKKNITKQKEPHSRGAVFYATTSPLYYILIV